MEIPNELADLLIVATLANSRGLLSDDAFANLEVAVRNNTNSKKPRRCTQTVYNKCLECENHYFNEYSSCKECHLMRKFFDVFYCSC